jgi:hypothetical protein
MGHPLEPLLFAPGLMSQEGAYQQHLPGRTHLRASRPAGTPRSGPPSPARRAAALPDGGRGCGRRRHSPGSASSSAGGSSRAGNPRHHLPPPPCPWQRLPTAHAAPPTDTTVGVPGARPPAAAPNSGKREWSRKEGHGQAPRLWVRGRSQGAAAGQSRGARATGRDPEAAPRA